MRKQKWLGVGLRKLSFFSLWAAVSASGRDLTAEWKWHSVLETLLES